MKSVLPAGYAAPNSTKASSAVGISHKLEVPQRQVMANMNELDEALSELQQLLNSLADRLTPVLCMQDLQEGRGENGPEPTAPLAALLQSHSQRLYGTNCQLRDILKRLEL